MTTTCSAPSGGVGTGRRSFLGTGCTPRRSSTDLAPRPFWPTPTPGTGPPRSRTRGSACSCPSGGPSCPVRSPPCWSGGRRWPWPVRSVAATACPCRPGWPSGSATTVRPWPDWPASPPMSPTSNRWSPTRRPRSPPGPTGWTRPNRWPDSVPGGTPTAAAAAIAPELRHQTAPSGDEDRLRLSEGQRHLHDTLAELRGGHQAPGGGRARDRDPLGHRVAGHPAGGRPGSPAERERPTGVLRHAAAMVRYLARPGPDRCRAGPGPVRAGRHPHRAGTDPGRPGHGRGEAAPALRVDQLEGDQGPPNVGVQDRAVGPAAVRPGSGR